MLDGFGRGVFPCRVFLRQSQLQQLPQNVLSEVRLLFHGVFKNSIFVFGQTPIVLDWVLSQTLLQGTHVGTAHVFLVGVGRGGAYHAVCADMVLVMMQLE